jgi:hypothetical protein
LKLDLHYAAGAFALGDVHHDRPGFPLALMERAATTAFFAANQLLHAYGVAGHNLWSVPMRSRHQVVKGFASPPPHSLVIRAAHRTWDLAEALN